MHEALVEHLENCKAAEAAGKQLPQISRYLAECFLQLNTRIATRGQFNGYSYKEECQGDGLVNCIAQIRSYNPAKSNNAFAYFTTIIKNAFIRRIKFEHNQHAVKLKNMTQLNINDELSGIRVDHQRNEMTDAYLKNFEEKNIKKKVKSNETGEIKSTTSNSSESNRNSKQRKGRKVSA